jgi:hypothetical protein
VRERQGDREREREREKDKRRKSRKKVHPPLLCFKVYHGSHRLLWIWAIFSD